MARRTTAAVPEASLTLRLFGFFEAFCGGRPLPSMRTRKEVWLLCLLALRQGQTLEREWLAGVLWPDSEESQALYNLRRCLSNLREAMRTEPEPIIIVQKPLL